MEINRVKLDPQSWFAMYEHWLSLDEQTLINVIHWQQHYISMFARLIAEPRLSAWIGEPHCRYRYSGQWREPFPWPKELISIRDAVQEITDQPFNCMLANWYRDGQDSMGWHRDNEPQLGESPMIASVSFGQRRRFLLRDYSSKVKVGELLLGEGDLLVMGGKMQTDYEHCIAKTKRTMGSRFNLTFRYIAP